MQSMHIPSDKWGGPRAGNMKLRGKLSKACTCGCCVATNFKHKERVKEANNEIKTGATL